MILIMITSPRRRDTFEDHDPTSKKVGFPIACFLTKGTSPCLKGAAHSHGRVLQAMIQHQPSSGFEAARTQCCCPFTCVYGPATGGCHSWKTARPSTCRSNCPCEKNTSLGKKSMCFCFKTSRLVSGGSILTTALSVPAATHWLSSPSSFCKAGPRASPPITRPGKLRGLEGSISTIGGKKQTNKWNITRQNRKGLYDALLFQLDFPLSHFFDFFWRLL